MSTDLNLKQTVTTAPAVATKSSVQVTSPVQTVNALVPKVESVIEQKVEHVVKELPFVHGYDSKNEYNGAPIVTLRLKHAHTMQYDAVFKLKLDSTNPVRCPLTPFFAGRINQTILLSV